MVGDKNDGRGEGHTVEVVGDGLRKSENHMRPNLQNLASFTSPRAQIQSPFIYFQISKPLFGVIVPRSRNKTICFVRSRVFKSSMANVQEVNSGFSTPKTNKKRLVIETLDDDDDSPLRPIFCLKRKSAIKEFDDKEDCFILDFNPEEDSFDKSVEKGDLNDLQDSPDISLIAEKGQVACRDYPHSRHLCVKHPFTKTPHESYCKLCYCYVCDVPAPCIDWNGMSGHCHAIDNEGWKSVKELFRTRRNP